jgi:hypothetical protein
MFQLSVGPGRPTANAEKWRSILKSKRAEIGGLHVRLESTYTYVNPDTPHGPEEEFWAEEREIEMFYTQEATKAIARKGNWE